MQLRVFARTTLVSGPAGASAAILAVVHWLQARTVVANLLVRNIDDDISQALKDRARAHGASDCES